MAIARGKGARARWRWVKRGNIGTERDFAWDNEHILQCVDGVLWSCILETYYPSINSIKKKINIKTFLYQRIKNQVGIQHCFL